MTRIFQAILLGPLISMMSNKKVRVVGLKPNKDLAYMNELYEAGKVKPAIGRSYKLSEVPEALRYFGEGMHEGKIVITLDENIET